jgi:calcium-activated chloride channel
MFQKLVAVMAAEHAILMLKYLVAVLIPDTPMWVRKELAYQVRFRHSSI